MYTCVHFALYSFVYIYYFYFYLEQSWCKYRYMSTLKVVGVGTDKDGVEDRILVDGKGGANRKEKELYEHGVCVLIGSNNTYEY